MELGPAGGRGGGISQTVTFLAEYLETTFLTGTKNRDHKKSVMGISSTLSSPFLFHRHLADRRQHVQFVWGSAIKVLHLPMLKVKNIWKSLVMLLFRRLLLQWAHHASNTLRLDLVHSVLTQGNPALDLGVEEPDIERLCRDQARNLWRLSRRFCLAVSACCSITYILKSWSRPAKDSTLHVTENVPMNRHNVSK